MEHREPPRIFNAEVRGREPSADDPEPPWRPFRTFTPVHHVRRLRPHAVALVVAAAFLLVLVLYFAIRAAWDGVFAYVEVQGEYQLYFAEIRLNPDPPLWIKGGRDAFLARIRTRGRLPATFSTLNVDLQSMRSAFLHDPWVAGVDRIFIQGHRIVVLLSYREPVAIARFESNEPEVAVDAEGVLLDAKETDDTAADLTYLRYLSSPLKLEFGRKWMGNGSGRRESEPDPEVQRLVRLAAFLRCATRLGISVRTKETHHRRFRWEIYRLGTMRRGFVLLERSNTSRQRRAEAD